MSNITSGAVESHDIMGWARAAAEWELKATQQAAQRSKIEVDQRGRKVLVYEWAMKAAEAISEATCFTRIVQPGTDVRIYLAEIITEHADSAA